MMLKLTTKKMSRLNAKNNMVPMLPILLLSHKLTCSPTSPPSIGIEGTRYAKKIESHKREKIACLIEFPRGNNLTLNNTLKPTIKLRKTNKKDDTPKPLKINRCEK